MIKRKLIKQSVALMASSFFMVVAVCLGLLAVSFGILMLGNLLSYLSAILFSGGNMKAFHYVLIVLVVACSAGLGIPIFLLARNIQRSTESFSLLQFDDAEDDEEYDGEDIDFQDDGEELNEFLRKLSKTRNIGPFIPSPKTMDDLCPCGSGLKYKDCCGRSWL